MTIAAAYLVSEGVVLGADSSTTISVRTPQGAGGVLQVLTHAQKIFEVGENSRLGICTWGSGTIGNISHRSIVANLADRLSENCTVKEAAEELVSIAFPLVIENHVDFVGYYIGGWDKGTHEPNCYKIELRQKDKSIEPLSLGLCFFSGMPNFFARVFSGFDPGLPHSLKEELKRRFPNLKTEDDFESKFDQAFEKASLPLIAEGYKDLPIREAIDFIYTYLHITIKATKFKFGAPGCGGPIEIGFISTDRPFRWVKHKSFSSAIFEETDHHE
jgi:hypothetical protein